MSKPISRPKGGKNDQQETNTTKKTKATKEEILAVAEECRGNLDLIAHTLGVSPRTLGTRMHQHSDVKDMVEFYREQAKIMDPLEIETIKDEQSFVVSNLPDGANFTPELLLDHVGLDPTAWIITNVKAIGNHWGNPDMPSSQIKLILSCKQKTEDGLRELENIGVHRDYLKPIIENDYKPPVSGRLILSRKKGQERWLILSDQHAGSSIDWVQAHATVRALKDIKPTHVLFGGDLLDLGAIARHAKQDKSFERPVMYDIDCGAWYLHMIIEAAVKANSKVQFIILIGNHDTIAMRKLLDKAPWVLDMANPTGFGDQKPFMAFESFLNLQHLRDKFKVSIEMALNDKSQMDRYLNQVVDIAADFSFSHGTKTAAGSGNSARKKSMNKDYGVGQGHVHRLAIGHRTMYGIGGESKVLAYAEAGCSCRANVCYSEDQEIDWQQGALVVTVDNPTGKFEDTTSRQELIRYNENSAELTWRDYKWSAEKFMKPDANPTPKPVLNKWQAAGYPEIRDGFYARGGRIG